MIIAGGSAAARAAKSATMTIPIVFAIGVDPVGGGLVARLNRPGANITGATYLLQDLIGKRMGLPHEIVPAAAMIGYLRDPSGPFPEAETKDAETAARTLGVQLAFLNASTPSQIETAFTTLVERHIGALTIGAGAFFTVQYEQIARLAARHEMPVIYSREFVDFGGLMSYGPNLAESGTRAWIQRVIHDASAEDLFGKSSGMPKFGKKLTDEEIRQLSDLIASGRTSKGSG